MLLLALVVLCSAAVLGGFLAVSYFRGAPAPPLVLAIHAALGVASIITLRIALRHGLPHSGMGTAGFGPTATALLALTLVLGLRIAWLAWRRRRRPSELLVGTHALVAISGLVLVLSLVALG